MCLWVRNEEKGSKGKLSSKLRSTHMVVWREWEAPVTWRLLPVTCYLAELLSLCVQTRTRPTTALDTDLKSKRPKIKHLPSSNFYKITTNFSMFSKGSDKN